MGANQAIAVARLGRGGDSQLRLSTAEVGRGVLVRQSQAQFVCQFGNDAYANMLESTLVANGVDVSLSGRPLGLSSRQGIFLLEADGSVSSVWWVAPTPPGGQEAVAGIEAAVRDGDVAASRCCNGKCPRPSMRQRQRRRLRRRPRHSGDGTARTGPSPTHCCASSTTTARMSPSWAA